MNKALGMLIFAVGAAVGSAVTWKLTKDHYRRIADEEIESVKEMISDLIDDSEEEDPNKKLAQKAKEIPADINEYAAMVSNLEYVPYEEKNKEVNSTMRNHIEVISPDDYGNMDDYELVTLTYYADGVLTDTWDTVIEDIEDTVGTASLETFGEFEKDTVYVRNHREKIDYEIQRDLCRYVDVSDEGSQDDE